MCLLKRAEESKKAIEEKEKPKPQPKVENSSDVVVASLKQKITVLENEKRAISDEATLKTKRIEVLETASMKLTERMKQMEIDLKKAEVILSTPPQPSISVEEFNSLKDTYFTSVVILYKYQQLMSGGLVNDLNISEIQVLNNSS